jgi:GxxExxY protein
MNMNRESRRAVKRELVESQPVTEEVIAAAMEVHEELGPGLPREAYEEALAYELHLRGLKVERQKPFSFVYGGEAIDLDLRADLFVEDSLIVAVLATDRLEEADEAELRTCLRAADRRVSLLFNFNVVHLAEGIRRITDDY